MLHRLIVFNLLLVIVFLTSCGFQLRGQGILPDSLQVVVLDCRPVDSQRLCRAIRDQLTAQNISVVESLNNELAAGPQTQLAISSVKDKRRTASIAPDASTAEIEFSRSVDFKVHSPNLGEQGLEMTATQFQTYQYTELSVLGKEKEEQQVKDNLNQLLANEILNRAASAIALSDKQ